MAIGIIRVVAIAAFVAQGVTALPKLKRNLFARATTTTSPNPKIPTFSPSDGGTLSFPDDDGAEYHSGSGGDYMVHCFTDYFNSDITPSSGVPYTVSLESCADVCSDTAGCNLAVWRPGSGDGPCYLKSTAGTAIQDNGLIAVVSISNTTPSQAASTLTQPTTSTETVTVSSDVASTTTIFLPSGSSLPASSASDSGTGSTETTITQPGKTQTETVVIGTPGSSPDLGQTQTITSYSPLACDAQGYTSIQTGSNVNTVIIGQPATQPGQTRTSFVTSTLPASQSGYTSTFAPQTDPCRSEVTETVVLGTQRSSTIDSVSTETDSQGQSTTTPVTSSSSTTITSVPTLTSALPVSTTESNSDTSFALSKTTSSQTSSEEASTSNTASSLVSSPTLQTSSQDFSQTSIVKSLVTTTGTSVDTYTSSSTGTGSDGASTESPVITSSTSTYTSVSTSTGTLVTTSPSSSSGTKSEESTTQIFALASTIVTTGTSVSTYTSETTSTGTNGQTTTYPVTSPSSTVFTSSSTVTSTSTSSGPVTSQPSTTATGQTCSSGTSTTSTVTTSMNCPTYAADPQPPSQAVCPGAPGGALPGGLLNNEANTFRLRTHVIYGNSTFEHLYVQDVPRGIESNSTVPRLASNRDNAAQVYYDSSSSSVAVVQVSCTFAGFVMVRNTIAQSDSPVFVSDQVGTPTMSIADGDLWWEDPNFGSWLACNNSSGTTELRWWDTTYSKGIETCKCAKVQLLMENL